MGVGDDAEVARGAAAALWLGLGGTCTGRERESVRGLALMQAEAVYIHAAGHGIGAQSEVVVVDEVSVESVESERAMGERGLGVAEGERARAREAAETEAEAGARVEAEAEAEAEAKEGRARRGGARRRARRRASPGCGRWRRSQPCRRA